jgi:hypothetical protein
MANNQEITASVGRSRPTRRHLVSAAWTQTPKYGLVSMYPVLRDHKRSSVLVSVIRRPQQAELRVRKISTFLPRRPSDLICCVCGNLRRLRCHGRCRAGVWRPPLAPGPWPSWPSWHRRATCDPRPPRAFPDHPTWWLVCPVPRHPPRHGQRPGTARDATKQPISAARLLAKVLGARCPHWPPDQIASSI